MRVAVNNHLPIGKKNRIASLLCIFETTFLVLSDFINLTQVHNFTVSAQDIFTFRRLSVFTVSFTGILHNYLSRFVPS